MAALNDYNIIHLVGDLKADYQESIYLLELASIGDLYKLKNKAIVGQVGFNDPLELTSSFLNLAGKVMSNLNIKQYYNFNSGEAALLAHCESNDFGENLTFAGLNIEGDTARILVPDRSYFNDVFYEIID